MATPIDVETNAQCVKCQRSFFTASGKDLCLLCRAPKNGKKVLCDSCGLTFFSSSGKSTTCVRCRTSRSEKNSPAAAAGGSSQGGITKQMLAQMEKTNISSTPAVRASASTAVHRPPGIDHEQLFKQTKDSTRANQAFPSPSPGPSPQSAIGAGGGASVDFDTNSSLGSGQSAPSVMLVGPGSSGTPMNSNPSSMGVGRFSMLAAACESAVALPSSTSSTPSSQRNATKKDAGSSVRSTASSARNSAASMKSPDSASSNKKSEEPLPPLPTKQIAMSDVKKHRTFESCWLVVCCRVFDVTSFISKHPGGTISLLDNAGMDSTNEFLGHHSSGTVIQRYRHLIIGEAKGVTCRGLCKGAVEAGKV